MENKKTVTGTIKITPKPIGFFDPEPAKSNEPIPPSIIIFEEDLNCALNRDKVEVEIIGTEPGRNGKEARMKGRVIKVLERNKTHFVGSIEKREGKFVLVPDDFKFYKAIDIADSAEGSVVPKEGYKALVELTEWTDPKANPNGKIVEIIGPKGEHETEMRSILFEKGIVYDFPPAVEAEAEKVAEEFRKLKAFPDRRDFRNITTFTIDPASAKDFDDALSFENIDEQTARVGVHIADVSYFVRPGGELDREAREREFSTYLVDRTIPMLPEILSADLCSLNEKVDRLAFSAVFDILKKSGEIKARWFGRTIINSDKRFTYENAQEILDSADNSRVTLAGPLQELDRIAKIYRAENKKNGAIEFETEEIRFELDNTGKPVKIYKKPRLETMRMIEDWMLLANREVAKFIGDAVGKRGGAGLYRVHDVPNTERLASLSTFVDALGFELDPEKNGVSGKDLNILLKNIEGHASESLIKTAAVRAMAKAAYSPSNIGHFGLAFDHYTHFTSPIRRYPDLIVHRIMAKHLNKEPISKDEFALFSKISEEASEKEIATSEAERESIKYKQVEYMKDFVGKKFDAIISGVTEWGIYVEEPETKSEGMVRLKDLGNDFFSLDPKNYCVIGERTKKKFSLGDKIKVKLIAADLERKTLDFKII